MCHCLDQFYNKIIICSSLCIMVQPLFILLLAATYLISVEGVEVIDTQVIQGGAANSCPSDELREAAKANARNATRKILQDPVHECGEGVWYQVGYLNMSDSQQSCPSPWSEVVNGSQRSCNQVLNRECGSPVVFPVYRTYSRICGRVTGYGYRTVDAFGFRSFEGTIDEAYVDGLSVTRGSPRQHVWTLGAGHGGTFRCPCDNEDREFAPFPPSFVGDNYFCDGDYNGALWDGMDCTTNCCTFNSPPWFNVPVSPHTSDDIEVRICIGETTVNEEVSVSNLQFFVQ